jgi:hypothetical protein
LCAKVINNQKPKTILKIKNKYVDQHKGSYYNNPQYDEPTKDPELIKKYPKSLSPNVWPDEELPDFGRLFKKCGQLMVEVGLLVAHQCDKYGFLFFSFNNIIIIILRIYFFIEWLNNLRLMCNYNINTIKIIISWLYNNSKIYRTYIFRIIRTNY